MATPKERVVYGPELEVKGNLTREPADIQPLRQANELLQTLAHLLGFDGSESRFLRCTPGGVQRTEVEDASGRVLTMDATGRVAVSTVGVVASLTEVTSALLSALGTKCGATYAEVSLTGGGAVDTWTTGYGSGTYVAVSASTGPVLLYDSATAGAKTTPVGIVAPGHVRVLCMTNGFLDMASIGAAGKAHCIRYASFS